MPSDWVLTLPHAILAAGGLLVFSLGAFVRQRSSRFLFHVTLATVLAAGAVTSFLPDGAFEGMVIMLPHVRYFWILFCGIAVLTLLFIRQYARIRNFSGDEFYGILLFAVLGMFLLAGTDNWLFFFLGFEMLSISLYIMIAVQKGDTGGGEAGLKYFIMGSVASAILAFGIALVYSFSGTLTISASLGVSSAVANVPGLLLGLGLIVVGIGFKTSFVPFHLWTADVYQGATAPVTAFLSTGSKVALFAALVQFSTYWADALWTRISPSLWIMAALTMAAGNITALSQTSLKRLLAYSSIGHMGYLLMALLAIKQNSAPAIMFYLAVYALMDLGAFGTIGLLSAGSRDLDQLDDLKGAGWNHPLRSAVLAVCLLSLAGLPPTGGFIGKFFIFQSVLKAGFWGIALIGIATAIISVFFYLRVVVRLYMQPSEKTVAFIHSPAGNVAGAIVCTLLVLLGIAPSSLIQWVTRAAFG